MKSTITKAWNVSLVGLCVFAGIIVIIGIAMLNFHLDIDLDIRRIFGLLGSYWSVVFLTVTFLYFRTGSDQTKERSRAGYVYLLRSTSGLYKIGQAVDPKNRLKTFGVQLPFEVQFVHLMKCDDRFVGENALHKAFSKKRVKGEWFSLTPEDVVFIKTLGEDLKQASTQRYEIACPDCDWSGVYEKKRSASNALVGHRKVKHPN